MRSGQVQMILFFDWLFNPPSRDVHGRVIIARSNDEYYTTKCVTLIQNYFYKCEQSQYNEHVLKPGTLELNI